MVVGVQTHCDAEIHVSPVASLPLGIRTCRIVALHHLFFNANKLLPPGGASLKAAAVSSLTAVRNPPADLALQGRRLIHRVLSTTVLWELASGCANILSIEGSPFSYLEGA